MTICSVNNALKSQWGRKMTEKAEREFMSLMIACIGVFLISVNLKSDGFSVVIGVIGILVLSFGSILKGGLN